MRATKSLCLGGVLEVVKTRADLPDRCRLAPPSGPDSHATRERTQRRALWAVVASAAVGAGRCQRRLFARIPARRFLTPRVQLLDEVERLCEAPEATALVADC